MGKVIHFEIMGKDAHKLRKFYEEALGWKFNDSGMPGMEYLLANTGGSPSDGIDGALMSNPSHGQVVINTIEVDDVEATVKKVVASGGSHDGEFHDIPGVGKHAYIKDSEGIIHGIMKPTSEYKEKTGSNA